MTNPTDQSPTHPDQLLPWWVNNTLPPDERKVVEDHLRGCAQCTKEVRLLQQMKEHVQELPIQSPGQFGLHRLLTEVNRDKVVNRLRQRASSRWR
ncbi:MAG: anti-sigma factor, partial [Candidatus Binatia bacterium]